ncbi:SIR2 family protein [Chromobacterium piscinae]|uniref:SIR2 family protein n=1 Tax=Chromobacterium piscinae TaxID=686831 RepID=UPI003F7D6734
MIQVLAQEDTVIFIGSGVSLWAGLPTWGGMIEELAKFVEFNGGKADLIRSEARRGDLLQAASYGFDKLTKQQIGEFIRAACQYGRAKPHAIHEKIVSLGPRCFVTTNYDDLIEQSLRKWQPDRFYKPPITNRHLTETAEIIHARAIDFIFKPHGDAGDSESIILTREQYRQLLPQGERQSALESVKMILASRPVVYFGFGLRDPDFIYVRDLLANTYKGGTRDHYAIMADVSDAEIDYWRRHYGIHLVGYATTENPDKSRNHSELLTLLDTLLARRSAAVAPPAFDPKSPEVLLSLARHASALARMPKLTPEFSIRVHSVRGKIDEIWPALDRFDHSPVDSFLASGPERVVLIGLPGAGKTYALRRAAARLAECLNEFCLAETFDISAAVVPVFVDLKLYRGNLSQLVSQTLPISLPLHELVRAFKVKFFLDSFNEMPREFWESGSYESDFQSFIKSFHQASVVIGSRTSDGLAKLDMPAYCLDQIDERDVTTELQRLGINIGGRFGKETRWLLQRPFYFQYVASGAITLPSEAHPRDFYACLFESTNNAFASRFGIKMNLEVPLATVAYESLNRGEEAFPIAELIDTLKTAVDSAGIVDPQPQDIVNWLVSKSVLLPYSGSRIAFVHQSVTEYLAASELAKRYLSDPQLLREKLTLTRWDQALFLTLSLLPSEHADLFLRDVIKADFTLALNAVKYLETGRDEIISSLLSEVPKYSHPETQHTWNIQAAIQFGLPITEVHELELRAILECGGSLGGAAVIRLVELRGEQIKDEILRLLFEKRSDFNFCVNGVGHALEPFASQQDASIIAAWADIIQSEISSDGHEDDDVTGFISGASEILSSLDLSVVRDALLPSEDGSAIPAIRASILCDVIRNHDSTDALNLAAELLLRGVSEACVAIYFLGKYHKNLSQLSWESFSEEHVRCFHDILETEGSSWALGVLKLLCGARDDLAELVEQIASHKLGIAKVAFHYCVSPTDLVPVFDALRKFTELSEEERNREPLHLLRQISLDWSGKGDLFVELLKARDRNLTQALMGGSLSVRPTNLGTIEIGMIEWWLDWMLEVVQDRCYDDSFWFAHQLGTLFANQLSQEKKNLFFDEFNKSNSIYRQLLLHFILPHFQESTTDFFNEDTISFIFADLNREGATKGFGRHLLGNAATERFVTERILPLLREAQPPLEGNLRVILSQAGSRHGRRYIVE